MDSPKYPLALENLKAWQHTNALAARSLRLVDKPAFQRYSELSIQIQESAIKVPSILSRRMMAPIDAEEIWFDFSFEEAGAELQRLKTLLYIANELGLIGTEEGTQLLDGIESSLRLITGLHFGQVKHAGPGAPKPKIKPSGSPGPSRRPPASGGGSRGGDPWDTRS